MDGAAISDLVVSEGPGGFQYPASIDNDCAGMIAWATLSRQQPQNKECSCYEVNQRRVKSWQSLE